MTDLQTELFSNQRRREEGNLTVMEAMLVAFHADIFGVCFRQQLSAMISVLFIA